MDEKEIPPFSPFHVESPEVLKATRELILAATSRFPSEPELPFQASVDEDVVPLQSRQISLKHLDKRIELTERKNAISGNVTLDMMVITLGEQGLPNTIEQLRGLPKNTRSLAGYHLKDNNLTSDSMQHVEELTKLIQNAQI